MKKIYLMFLGTMFATCAMAQQGKGGLVLDSAYTTDGDNARQSKTINEYNAQKQLTASYTYNYFDENHQPLAEMRLEAKSELTYNGNNITQMDTYNYANGEYTLAARLEMSDFDASTGTAKQTIMSAIDPENPSAGLQQSIKTVVNKVGSQGREDEVVYWWEDGAWTLFETVHYDYNADGTVAKETAVMGEGEEAMTQETTYEYDANKEVTKKVTSIPALAAFGMGESVTTYQNEYYADGNLKKVTETGETGISMDYYFWGDGKAKGGVSPSTGISLARQQLEKMQRIYDLNGRQVTNPTKGLYIVNGRKMIIK